MESTAAGAEAPKKQNEFLVIGASSVGTMFEWYDFFLYGSLATYINAHFFSAVPESTGFILTLAAFAAGFIVRPFGALVFGRVGDIVGRKNTFLVTMIIMGASTFVVGLLPGYEQIGVAAPILLVALRVLQGLAIGGEYGGAAIYVAEHAPHNRRGFYTSWIQITATIGLFASLLLIMLVRTLMPAESFNAWGWRIPFLLSIFLLGVSIWIRLQLNESPVFQKMKDEAQTSKAPWSEAFGNWKNLRWVLVALFGCVAGQAVIWYSGTFYGLFFLKQTLKVDPTQADTLVAISLAIGTPFYIVFGWLSDKIGRRNLILAGLIIPVVTYFTLFHMLAQAANPALAEAQSRAPVIVHADPAACTLQFDPVGGAKFDMLSCDIAKDHLTKAGISYTSENLAAGAAAYITIGKGETATRIDMPEPSTFSAFTAEERETAVAALRTQLKGAEPEEASIQSKMRAARIAPTKAEITAALDAAGYPAQGKDENGKDRYADPAKVNAPMVILILVLTQIFTAMIYGPMAAMLVELFPARVRYTAMSLPYHIGNGWFGGLLPTTAFMIVTATGDIYAGIWYPTIIAAGTFLVALLFLPETFKRDIRHYEDGEQRNHD